MPLKVLYQTSSGLGYSLLLYFTLTGPTGTNVRNISFPGFGGSQAGSRAAPGRDVKAGPQDRRIPLSAAGAWVPALPLGIDSSFGCFPAAAHYGRGYVVLAGHEGLILDHRFSLFVVNALCWPAADQNGKTGLNSEMHKLGPMLPKNNLQWTGTDLLISDLPEGLLLSLTDVNVKKIVEFAVEVGGLPIGKQAWFLASRNPNFNSLCQFPENKFLKCSGLAS